MEKSNNHFVVEGKQMKFDTSDDVKAAFIEAAEGQNPIDLSAVTKITIGGNSYGYEACEWLANLVKSQDTPKLKEIDFSNIFVSRLRAELPRSLEIMALALLPKQLIEVDLSDNAFGPDGIRAFQCLLKEDKNLKILKVSNCGLGPQGGEMIAEGLLSNKDCKLTHFHAGRDRLENVGIIALAKVFQEMGSLEEIHVPQNGIKDSGMKELFQALCSCKNLHTVRVNDNWLKTEATEMLLSTMIQCQDLKELNISDGNMGTANVLAVLRAYKKSGNKKLRHFCCNYNDVEQKKAADECLQILCDCTVNYVEFVGNVQSKKLKKEWWTKYDELERVLKFKEDEEESDEDDEEEEEEEDDTGYESALTDLCEKLDKLQICEDKYPSDDDL